MNQLLHFTRGPRQPTILSDNPDIRAIAAVQVDNGPLQGTVMSHSPLPFGHILGYAPGNVAAYSSDYDSVDREQLPDRHAFRHYLQGVYTGYKWQCVEFARRWLLLNKGYVFDDIAMAYDIFKLDSVRVIANNQRLPLKAFANGAKRHPEPGCMLIWSEGGEFELTGHVAIVTDVAADSICVAEQNVHHQTWPAGQHYSRKLNARISADGSYWIECSFADASVLGWVIQTEDNHHAEVFPEQNPALFNLSAREIQPKRSLDKAWLNEANADEAAYVKANHGHRLSDDPALFYRYWRMSQSALAEVKRATNELHALFMHATDHVLQDDKLLAKFNIPEELWPRIHQSWDNRRNQMITGRFDFCLTEHGLKLYEYNADSASCHMETGKVQGKWAQHVDCHEGDDPGAKLHQKLVAAWRDSEAQGLVHILLDDEPEEHYHAQFMADALAQAGIPFKIVVGFDSLQWADDDTVLDADGEPILWVWKTWAWETALDELRDQLRESQHQRPAKPRLMDVLLRPEVMIFEPLWTLIPSNKAILPILWQLFPDHPYLLRSSYQLDDTLTNQGYVRKPIAGRCGANIKLVQHDDVTRTSGQFAEQDVIYQALAPLPVIAGYYSQLCSFTAAGNYAGCCIRLDKTPIITGKSDLAPLRIIADDYFL